jgi:5'-3' exonuclease
MYGHIAIQIDRILSKHMEKASTTLHWDGKPSEQKSAERRRRQEDLDKKLTKLQEDVAQAVNKKSAVPSRLYQLCRRLFRPSADILDDIKSELARLGWGVCTCDFQADTHIAQICQDHEVEVVSGDSDLLVYEGINHITMPVGKNHELTTFQKSDVLSLLNLPSDRHLLLACLLTRNDYNEGIRGLGLKRNAAIVRGFDLDPRMELDQVITKAIEKYLNTIRDPRGKTINDYKNAISAFASLKEVWSPDAAPSAQTQDRIAMILMTLENHKSKRRLRGSQQQHQQQAQDQQVHPLHPPGHKRKRKKRRRRTSKKRQRQSKWRRSQYVDTYHWKDATFGSLAFCALLTFLYSLDSRAATPTRTLATPLTS